MFYWFGILILLPVIALIIGNYRNNSQIKKKFADIKEQWAKPKEAERNFNLIAAHFTHFDHKNPIAVTTATDLDTENIFAFIDRTSSNPGRQYLYTKLHCPETDFSRLNDLEKRVTFLNKDAALREQIQLKLSDLNSTDAYYLPELFSKTHAYLFDVLGRFYIKIAPALLIATAVSLCVVHNSLFFLLLFVLLITNAIIHYGNKSKMYSYTHSLPQLLLLINVAQWLDAKNLFGQSETFKQSFANLLRLKKSLGFINLQTKIAKDPTDITFMVTEWFKILFLTEPLIFISSIKGVNKYLGDIRNVYESVAEIDLAISIQSVRDGLPYYCKPDFISVGEKVDVTDCFHPLIENCVPNSMAISYNQGVLITGSNMSGKTTFIRAIAINSLLSQTIHTCCAREYHAPPLNIFTSINMTDDLGEHKSYFQSEALSVLTIIEGCEAGKPVRNLVIIDEIFRGTNTFERISAAKAVLSHLVENKCFVFVSTHDLELAELLGNDYKVFSFEEIMGPDRLIFDYKIKSGLLKNKNGIAVLKGLGYPDSIITEAQKVNLQLREKYEL